MGHRRAAPAVPAPTAEEFAAYATDGSPVTSATPMRLASPSKSFTATAVMRLVDAGRLRLDAPVAEQLPGFTMADPRYSAITVRHLLNQTSGLQGRSFLPGEG